MVDWNGTMDKNAAEVKDQNARLAKMITLREDERNKLSKDDLKRYEKLTLLLANLNAGKTVNTRELKLWLKDSYDKVAFYREEEKTYLALITDIPEELKDYERMLKLGDFYANRRDGRRKAQNNPTAMDDKADIAFDDAADTLRGILEENPDYVRFLDRDVSLEAGATNGIGHCEISIPRLITSRSKRRQGPCVYDRKSKIRKMQIRVVEEELRNIVDSVRYIDEKKPCAKSEKLQQLLNIDKDDDFF